MVQTLERETVELSPDPIYQMALGFAATKTLLAAQRLGVFKALQLTGKTGSDLAEELRLSPRGVEILLDTCVALKLLQKTAGVYTNAPLAARFLIEGQRGYLGRFLDHFNDIMYPTWTYLEDAIRTGHAQVLRVIGNPEDNFFQALDRQVEHLKTFMETMEEHSLLEAECLAKSYDFSQHRTILDVGGGTGAMMVPVLQRYPHLQAIVFDRPPVCQIADRSVQTHGVGDRIRTQPGDFLKDPLPQGADVLMLSAILHNWSPAQAQTILKQCHKALPVGGTLLISEQVLNDEKTAPLAGLLCSLNMLILLEGAQEYSRLEFKAFLQATGFELLEVRPTGGIRQLLVARKV